MDFFFQSPPRPLQVWPIPPPVPNNFVRPQEWSEKHFGQWCRNLSLGMHTQCPRGSPFHWYVCCGHGMAECCFGIQTWVIVMFGSLLAVLLGILVFSFWLSVRSSKLTESKERLETPTTAAAVEESQIIIEEEEGGEEEDGQRRNTATVETKLELEPPMP